MNMNQIHQHISNNLSGPKRRRSTLVSSSSNLVTGLLILIILLFCIFIFLILTTTDQNRKLTFSTTILSNKLKELSNIIYSYDNNINVLIEENNKIELQLQAQKEKASDLTNQEDILHNKIVDAKEIKTTLENSINTLNHHSRMSNEELKQLTDKINHHVTEEEVLKKKVEELKRTLSKREEELRSQKQIIVSEILTKQSQFDILNEWIIPNKNRHIKYNLLFRGSNESLTPKGFHLTCDDNSIHNSLVLILLNDGQIIGGFTKNNWSSNLFKKDNDAFVFNINNQMKYNIIKDAGAIICDSNSMPQFGIGDIEIKDSQFTSTFPKSYGLNAQKNELTNGINALLIRKIEVFTLFFSYNEN